MHRVRGARRCNPSSLYRRKPVNTVGEERRNRSMEIGGSIEPAPVYPPPPRTTYQREGVREGREGKAKRAIETRIKKRKCTASGRQDPSISSGGEIPGEIG